MTNKIVFRLSILAVCALGTQAFATAEIAPTPITTASPGSVRFAQVPIKELPPKAGTKKLTHATNRSQRDAKGERTPNPGTPKRSRDDNPKYTPMR
jgi:hypothetical protein